MISPSQLEVNKVFSLYLKSETLRDVSKSSDLLYFDQTLNFGALVQLHGAYDVTYIKYKAFLGTPGDVL